MEGRPYRGASSALTARQYYGRVPGDAVTKKLAEALNYIKVAAQYVPARYSRLTGSGRRPLVIYTDCSTSPEMERRYAATGIRNDQLTSTAGLPTDLRVGILLCDGAPPHRCAVEDIPQHVIKSWFPRITHICQGELVAGPIVAMGMNQYVKNRGDMVYRQPSGWGSTGESQQPRGG